MEKIKVGQCPFCGGGMATIFFRLTDGSKMVVVCCKECQPKIEDKEATDKAFQWLKDTWAMELNEGNAYSDEVRKAALIRNENLWYVKVGKTEQEV